MYGWVPALCLICLLSGCASIVSDNKSVTYLETVPEACKCELHGQDFKRVVNTPNSISLPSEAAPITIACSAPGYKRTTATLDTKADGWIWGNILFGGVIGAVIDGAKGSGFKFPPKYSLVLEPEQFASLDERDAWFNSRKAEIEARWDREMSRLRGQCASASTGRGRDEEDGCADLLGKAERKKQEELDQNEKARIEAKVAQMAQAAS